MNVPANDGKDDDDVDDNVVLDNKTWEEEWVVGFWISWELRNVRYTSNISPSRVEN